jgi:hypothetical protein
VEAEAKVEAGARAAEEARVEAGAKVEAGARAAPAAVEEPDLGPSPMDPVFVPVAVRDHPINEECRALSRNAHGAVQPWSENRDN